MSKRGFRQKYLVEKPKSLEIHKLIKLLDNGQIQIPKAIKQHMEFDIKYVEILQDESRPDVLILKPLQNYTEPTLCYICSSEINDYKVFRGQNICLNCVSIINGTKTYKIKKSIKKYTHVKPSKPVHQSNFKSVSYIDWCIFCGGKKDIVMKFKDKNVCDECKNSLLDLRKNRVYQRVKLML